MCVIIFSGCQMYRLTSAYDIWFDMEIRMWCWW